MTEYVVLAKIEADTESDSGSGWYILGTGTVTARSANAAIRERLGVAEGNPAGVFVAVPARSWKPVTVKVETKTALKFS